MTMRLRDIHSFKMHFLHPFDKCHGVGNILLLDCHTKPTLTNSTLKWKYPVTTLPFTQLASQPFFSICRTTPVFSLNPKFLSACVNVVLHTFSYSPRAAITCFCQNFTPSKLLHLLLFSKWWHVYIQFHFCTCFSMLALRKLSLRSEESSCLDRMQHLCCLLES